MRYISLFSGIEAATAAWHPLGWSPLAFAEIEPFPASVLAHHYPGVPNLGDVTKFKEWPDFGAIDLIVGGAPCQAFSVAGLRAGLADPRGNLTLTYLAVIAKYQPKWVLFENVPGILSSTSHDAPDQSPPPDPVGLELDGQEVDVEDEYVADETHAFSAFMAGLQELGYGIAYRVLDAQFCRALGFPHAVPQRRRRVFVVGYLGDWRRAAAVLFDAASLRGDSAPRREAGKRVAPTISSRPKANRSVPKPGDPVHPLAAGAHAPAIAFKSGQSEAAGAFFATEEYSPTLQAANNGSTAVPAVFKGWAVRRLIPVECERLQGFPDGYTAVPYRNKPATDGPRYKSLGNSMAVNCMRVLGERIQLVEAAA